MIIKIMINVKKVTFFGYCDEWVVCAVPQQFDNVSIICKANIYAVDEGILEYVCSYE